MAVFPSREWCEEAIGRANADPDFVLLCSAWDGGDFGVIIEAEPGALEASFVAHVVPEGGKIARFEQLDDPDDLDACEPAYRVEAPYSVWKGLLTGTLDPLKVLVTRKIKVHGDVQKLISRAHHRHVADKILTGTPTRFIDEP